MSPASRSSRSGATPPPGRRAATSSAKKPSAKGTRLRRVVRAILIVGIIGVIVTTATFVVAYRKTTIPEPNEAFESQTTKIFYADGKTKIGQFANQNRESIPLADIPQTMQDAVVAAEDRTFWTNKGVDPKGIIRAAFSNAKGGSTQGASTITQQYVKLLYLNQERTLKRKIKEALLSLKVQQQYSKSQILEGYLNTVYFGRGAYGVQAAAYAFFRIPARKLDVAQSAMLAAVLNSPNNLSPDRSDQSRKALLGRYQYVLSSMVDEGTLSSDEAARLHDELPTIKPRRTDNQLGGQRGFMLDMVRNELLDLGFDEEAIEGGGLRVTATFDQNAMDAARDAVLEQRPDGFSDKELHVGVASVDVKTGAVLGFYGGQDYLQSQLNWALQRDSPGSAFKPFAVAAGLKAGFSLKDTFDGNSPYVFPDGSKVRNEGSGNGQSYGAHVSLLTATEQSINTAFIDLTQSMNDGPQEIRDTAIDLGIPDNQDLQPLAGISLGSAPQRPMDMANAYATIANGGMRHDWYVVSKVINARTGEVLFRADPSSTRVLDEDIAADTSYAMQQVVKAGTGRAALALGRPAAGKTGTATDHKDHVVTSWFVGFTPQVATAVMYVRGDGRQPLDGWLPSYFGATYPARTWTAAMQRIEADLPREEFPPPAWVDGDAPSSGHEAQPEPKPKPKPKPKPEPEPEPTEPPTPTPTETPTTPPTTEPPTEPPTEPECDPDVDPSCSTGRTVTGSRPGTEESAPRPPGGRDR